jgi:polysaccharide deacetylase 2 family uncharacterized protein YibQ
LRNLIRLPDCRLRRLPANFLIGAFLVLAGCQKEGPTKKELRAVTNEIATIAQRVTGHDAEVTVRRPSRSLDPDLPPPLSPDDVYLLLDDPSRLGSLRRAFNDIARRHHLSVSETRSKGSERFEFAFNGTATQTVHLVVPLVSLGNSGSRGKYRAPQLAIILDDVGYDRAAADALLSLPFTVTLSVLPHLPLSSAVAEEAFRRGDEVMLHLPMQSEVAAPEGVQLQVGMSPDQVNSVLTGMLETVPHAVGVNNHEGSRATADPALMQGLMPALHQRGLFFIDSRTTAATVAYDAARHSGVRAASRRIFLDDTVTPEAIRAQLNLAARDAVRDGSAIAIGHPHPDTVATLASEVPLIESRGVRLVFASQLVH